MDYMYKCGTSSEKFIQFFSLPHLLPVLDEFGYQRRIFFVWTIFLLKYGLDLQEKYSSWVFLLNWVGEIEVHPAWP